MLDRADAILKLALAVAALMIGCAFGYYYAIFLPSQAAASLERASAFESAKVVAATVEKESYRQCLAAAYSTYSENWDAQCKLERETNPKIPEKECSLSNAQAETQNSRLKDEKRLCLDAFKAAN